MVASRFFQLPLRIVLIVPFVLQIVAAVGLVGYLSFKNGQRAVEGMAAQLMEEVSGRIDDRLDRYLEANQQMVGENRLAVQQGILDLANWKRLRQQLWHQIILHPSQAELAFANEQGESIFYGRASSQEKADLGHKTSGIDVPMGMLYFAEEKKTRPGQRTYYQVDPQGNARKPIHTSAIDSRKTFWYLHAKAVGKQTWSPIIPLKAVPTLGIAAVAPIYSATGKLQGVFAVNCALSDISTFLSQLRFSRSGQAFIIDRAGHLIATSTLELPYIKSVQGQLTPLLATNSRDPQTREVARYLAQRAGNFRTLQSSQQVRLVSQGEGLFVEVLPYQDAYGLDWLIVVVVPKSDFMAEIYSNTYSTLLLSTAALGVAIALGLLTANRITQRISQINRASQELASGKLERPIEIVSSITELEELTQSFNGMAWQIQESFYQIQLALQESEAKFTTIFRTSPDPIAIITFAESRIWEVNYRLLEFFGHSRDEVIGRTTLELGWWGNLQDRQQIRQLLQQQRKLYNLEAQACTKSGELKTVLLSAELCNLEGVDCVIVVVKDISDRKQAEAEILKSKLLIEQVTESSSAILYLFDLIEQRNVYINSQIEQLLGYSPEEIQAMGNQVFQILVHPEDLPKVIENSQKLQGLADGKWQEVDYRMQDKQGEWHWLYSRDRILSRTASGQPQLIVGTATDFTERKKLELALETSKAKLNDILNSAVAAITSCRVFADDNWEIEHISAGCEVISGYTAAEIKADKNLWMSRIHPEDLQVINAKVWADIFAQRTESYEYRLYHKEGRLVWISQTTSSRWDDIQKCWIVIAISLDITARKQAEAALGESETQFSTIFHTSPDPAWIATLAEGRIFNANDRLVKFSGYTSEELIGKTCVELGFWDCLEDLYQFRKTLVFQGRVDNFEVLFRVRSGEARTVLISAKVSTINRQSCVIGLLKDISDRKALELALQMSESRLRSILNNASAFISGVRLVTNQTWEYEYFSPGIEPICGYTGEEIAADPALLMSLILPEDLETIVKPALERLLTPNFVTTLEFRLRHRDGRIRWVANSMNTRWDEITQSWYGTGILVDISDLKEAEAALQQSEARLGQLAAASPGIIYTVIEDPKGPVRYEYLSPVFELIHEVSIAEVKKNAAIPFNQIHPEDREGYQQAVTKALEGMQLFRHEWRIVTPSGKIKWLQANSRPECLETGEIVWHGIVLEVTDRKRAEEALRITSTRLHNLARAMPGVLYSLVQYPDGSLKFEYINRAVEEIFEISVEDAFANAENLILGQMHPDDRPGYLEAAKRNLETLETFTYEWRIITPSGQLKWVQAYSQVERRDHQEICQHGVFLDISDRKWAESALRQSESALVEAQKIASMGSWSFDVLTEAIIWSEEMFRIFGRNPEQGTPTYEELIAQTYPDDVEQLLENIEIALTQGKSFEHEIRIIRPDGSIHYTFGKGHPIVNEGGQVVKILGIVQDISDRKLAEVALGESEERFRQLAENLPLFFGLRSADYQCWLYASPSFEKIVGRSLELLYNNPLIWIELIHPDDRDWIVNHKFTEPSLEYFSAEFRIIKPNGEICWLRSDEFPVRNEVGEIYRVATFAEDITTRKVAEEALRQSESALAEAQRISHLGNWSFDVIAQKITWSEETYRIYGLDPTQGDPTYKQLLQLTHPDDVGVLIRNVERAISEGKAYEHEIRVIRPNGEMRHTLGKGQAILDSKGQVVQLFGTVQDISDRKLAEIALRESLERERTLFHVTQKMRQTLDLETIFRTVTQDLQETLGCSRISIYRCHPDVPYNFIAESVAPGWVPLVGNYNDRRWQDFFLQISQGIQEGNRDISMVPDIYQSSWNDGYIKLLEQFQARSFCSVPVEVGEQLWGILSAYQNNAPRDWKLEEIQLLTQVGIQLGVAIQQAELFAQIQNQSIQLQKAVDAANAANRAKSAFLANMSHELRTPLNAILGFAQLISQSSEFSPKVRENIATINWSGQHLLTLINDVLDMAKIESGCTVLNEQVFNLHRLLYELERMFKLKAREKGLNLEFYCHDRLPDMVRADGIKLRQILINLIGNAIKFTKIGQVSVRVNWQAIEREHLEFNLAPSPSETLLEIDDISSTLSLLQFEVEDTGVGIPESELNNIFEPFLQTRMGQQSQEGTGLGLAISRSFVELMGGKLMVRSQVGQGSNFCFYIQVSFVNQLQCDIDREWEIPDTDEPILSNEMVTRLKDRVLNPSDIANLPLKIIERLEQALIRASWQEIYNIVELEISTVNFHLSKSLKQLIDKFEYTEILTAIEQAKKLIKEDC